MMRTPTRYPLLERTSLNDADDKMSSHQPNIQELMLVRAGDVERNPGPRQGLIDIALQDKELISLAKDVPGNCYHALCTSLGFSYTEGQHVLTKHRSDIRRALIELFCRWKIKQRDGTDCRAVLGEILKEADMDALRTKLLEGGYHEFETETTGGYHEFETETTGGYHGIETKSMGGYHEFETETTGGYHEFETETRGGYYGVETIPSGVYYGFETNPTGGYHEFKTETTGGYHEFETETTEQIEENESGTIQEPVVVENPGDTMAVPPEILARGTIAQEAYAEAAKAGTKKVFRTRLMIVGQERVGKTSLKKTLTGQGFNEHEGITDGVEITYPSEINIQTAKADGKSWSIHTKGHENEDMKETEYSRALALEVTKKLRETPPQGRESLEPQSGAPVGRGLNPQETDESISDDMEGPKAGEDDGNEQVGADSSRGMTGEDINAHATRMPNHIESLVVKNLKEVGTDSTDGGKDDGVSLSIWDFAGHDIYYTTHQVFLNWRSIYVVVFDLSRDLDSPVPPVSRDDNYETVKGGSKEELTCLEFINFWLCSIFAHAVAPSSVVNKNASKTNQKSPPIFIVGTHRGSVTGDAKEKKRKIDAAFEKIRKTIKKKPFECHVVPKYYAVENSLDDKDEELIALRRQIEKVAKDEPYMGEEVPLRWLLFEEALAAERTNYMSLDQTKELTLPIGMESERELLTMLTFYHDLGYVVYYGGIDDQQSLLRDIVILNPQWLIDVFKQVISILDPEERDGIVSDAWTTLEDDGILEDRLIQHMWKDFPKQQKALVQLMVKFDLICEAPVEQLQPGEETEVEDKLSDGQQRNITKRYYVPSRLSSRCPPEEIGQIKSSTDFYINFKGFLPDGFFHRLMARAVRWMRERDDDSATLYYRQISLKVDDKHHALLEMLPPDEATIKVIVYQAAIADPDDDSDNNQPPAPSAVKIVMDFVTRTLDSLRQHWAKRIQYDIRFLCPSRKCSKRKLLQECFKRKSLKCGNHSITADSIKLKFGFTDEGVDSESETRSTRKESSVLCDSYFCDLAEKIGSEWHRLGIRLGLNNADIDHITVDNQLAVERTYKMLQLWRQRTGSIDEILMVEKLCEGLKRCNRADLADGIREKAGLIDSSIQTCRSVKE